jgi:hypothetical protein
VKKLVAEGLVVTRPVRGGVMLYKADEAPASVSEKKTSEVLRQVLGR